MTRSRRGFAPRQVERLESRRVLAATHSPALLVGVVGSASERAITLLRQIQGVGQVELLSPTVLRVEPAEGTALRVLASAARRIPSVRFIEHDSSIAVESVTPSDPGFVSQWGLESANNVDIDAGTAWQFSTGSAGTIVAIVDSGIDARHPDLSERLWINPREIPGNFFDDDGNGLVDDVNGWNFLDNNANLSDDAGHGSHVAGIIAAASDNGVGISGVDWQARIMPLKFIDAAGNGSLSDAVRAIQYAINNGARVINASWGGSTPSKALNDAIRNALNHEVVFVTAAGNESVNNDVYRSYPAAYRLPNVLVVAAVNPGGQLAGFSNFGPKSVDLAAPGVDIRSTLPGGNYGTISGTSMAAPFVSGVVSLLVSQNPSASATQLVKRVAGTTKPLASLANRTISGGMVSAAQALNPGVPTRTPGTAPAPKGNAQKPRKVVVTSRLAQHAGDNIRATILGTDDYFAIKGGTSESFLNALYLDVVGRSIAANERRNWLAAIASGVSRTQIARSLLGAIEAQRTKVARWYLRDFGAPAGLGALKSYGPVIALAKRMYNKAGESMVHASLFGSAEYSRASGGSALGMLGGYYRTILGREIGVDEASYWLGRIVAGAKMADIALALLVSSEGRQTRVALWYQRDLGSAASLAELKTDPGVIAWAAQLVD